MLHVRFTKYKMNLEYLILNLTAELDLIIVETFYKNEISNYRVISRNGI